MLNSGIMLINRVQFNRALKPASRGEAREWFENYLAAGGKRISKASFIKQAMERGATKGLALQIWKSAPAGWHRSGRPKIESE